jgi:hypothetical protein
MKVHKGLPCLVLVLSLLLPLQAAADEPPAVGEANRTGNYCVECHSAGDPRLAQPLAWSGSLAQVHTRPCLTARSLHEEMFHTQDLMDGITHAAQSVNGWGINTDQPLKAVLAQRETLSRVIQEPADSQAVMANEIEQTRFKMNRSFSQLQASRQAATGRLILIIGVVVSVILASGLVLGYRYTFRGKGRRARAGWGSALAAGLLLLIVFALFALPLSAAVPGPAQATEQDAARQASLDAAKTAAVSAERLSAQAWMLARIGAAWTAVDPAGGSQAVTDGLAAMDELKANAPAYWGRRQAVLEDSVEWTQDQQTAALLADRIGIGTTRAWALRAMAGELLAVDPAQAGQVLARALDTARQEDDAYYRALDLRGIAVLEASLDADKGLEIASEIGDPYLRAWGLREIGQGLAASDSQQAQAVYASAYEAAKQVSTTPEKARALWELATAWSPADPAQAGKLFDEALQTARTVQDPVAQSHLLSDLAAAWAVVDPARAQEVAGQLAGGDVAAQVYALRDVALGWSATDPAAASATFAQAWQQAKELPEGYDRSRAMADLVANWAGVDPDKALAASQEITDSYYQAEAQRDVALALAGRDPDRALELARSITLPYAQVEALTGVGTAQVQSNPAGAAQCFAEALGLVDQVHDTYPLERLVAAWTAADPAQALAAVDQIQGDVDKAVALREVSVALAATDRAQAETVFDRALNLAKSLRRRGDDYAAAEALRQLGMAWTPIDPAKAAQAFETAVESVKRVSTKF